MGARTVAICLATASVLNKNKRDQRGENIKLVNGKKVLSVLKVCSVGQLYQQYCKKRKLKWRLYKIKNDEQAPICFVLTIHNEGHWPVIEEGFTRKHWDDVKLKQKVLSNVIINTYIY